MNATTELQDLTAQIEQLKTRRDKIRAGIAAAAEFQPGDFVYLSTGEGEGHTAYIHQVCVTNAGKIEYLVKSSREALVPRAVLPWYKLRKI